MCPANVEQSIISLSLKRRNRHQEARRARIESIRKISKPRVEESLAHIMQRPRSSTLSWVAILAASMLMLIISIAMIAECDYGKRTQYHEQGVHGPKSYKFGFTSGDHKNPQERHEVSDGYGHVKGWYSFVDATGKHQVVHYEAHPKYGFKVFNHKSKALNNGKRHYNS